LIKLEVYVLLADWRHLYRLFTISFHTYTCL